MKLQRLLETLILLLNREKVQALELAERFEVSIRTIYRDIQSLNDAEIPISSFQGAGGGFQIDPAYRLDRQIFNFQDLKALLNMLEDLKNGLNIKEIEAVFFKIKSLLSYKDQNKIEDKSLKELIVDFTPWGSPLKIEEDKTNLIKKAISQNRLLDFSYTNAQNKHIKRQVEPMTLILKGFNYYLFAFCRLKNDYRLFRLSRITDITLSKSLFKRRKEDYYSIFGNKKPFDKTKLSLFTLSFHPSLHPVLLDYFNSSAISEDENGFYIIEDQFPENEAFLSYLLSFGNKLKVLKPIHVQKKLQEKAAQIINLYK